MEFNIIKLFIYFVNNRYQDKCCIFATNLFYYQQFI